MTNPPQKITAGNVDVGTLTAGARTAASIETGHLAICIINMETGKQGVRHLYSKAYEEMWPRDGYPEHYQDDVPLD